MRDTIEVNERWNLIGSLSDPVPVTSLIPIDPVTLQSHFIGYTNATGYRVEDTLKPGRAYWIKTNQWGKLVLQSGNGTAGLENSSAQTTQRNSALPTSYSLDGDRTINRLVFKDHDGKEQALYFTARNDVDASGYELPPAAPTGRMDVRFATQRILEVAEANTQKDVPILVTAAKYPVMIQWSSENVGNAGALTVDGKKITLSEKGQIHIAHSTSHRSEERRVGKECRL